MYACMHALRYYHYPLLTLPEVVITFFLETNVTFGKLDWGNNPSKYMLYTYSGVLESVGCMQRSLIATKSHAIHLLRPLGGKKEKKKKKQKDALHSYIHFTSRSYATKILLSRG